MKTKQQSRETSEMLVRVSAEAIKIAYPFLAQGDIRFYLNAFNVRPLEKGVLLTACDGHRFLAIKDEHGFAKSETTFNVPKDATKHCKKNANVYVRSDDSGYIQEEGKGDLFLFPKSTILSGVEYPRIESIVDPDLYHSGIAGEFNPSYLQDALNAAKNFSNVQFFSCKAGVGKVLLFNSYNVTGLNCVGGIMPMSNHDFTFPKWLAKLSDDHKKAKAKKVGA